MTKFKKKVFQLNKQKGKTTLPNTRANVTDADINVVFRISQVINPPLPPRFPRRDSSDRFRFVTTRRGRHHYQTL